MNRTTGRPKDYPVARQAGRTVDWGEFYDAVNFLTAELKQDPTVNWILFCQDSLYFAQALLALCQAGKTVILPPNAQAGLLASLAGLKAKIISDGPLSTGAAPDILVQGKKSPDRKAEFRELDPDKIYLKMFTSGSTGEPKLIDKVLNNFVTEVEGLEKAWGELLGDSVFYGTVVHNHIYGLLFRVLWPLSRGSIFSAHLITTPEELQPLYRENDNIALASSPAFMKRLQELAVKDVFPEKKFQVFSSGGLLLQDTSLEMRRVFGSCPWEVLGSTETGGVAYRTQEDKNQAWTPFPVVRLKLDEDGQLFVKSPFIESGDFIPMGDMAEFLPDGKRFILKGRVDNIVKIEEKRVSLTEIERRLHEHPFIAKASAVAIQHKRQMIGVAIVLSAKGKEHFLAKSKVEINKFWREHLLQYFEPVVLPRKWRYVDSLPVNEQGKLLSGEVRKMFAGVK
jgi:acyl-coenzyme A synthetase/AMP-(fatty) acid ligase